MAPQETLEMNDLLVMGEDDRSRRVGDFARNEKGATAMAARYLVGGTGPEQAIAADILGQVAANHPGSVFRVASVLLEGLQNVTDPSALGSIAVALGHTGDGRAIDPLVGLATHPDARVRFGVAFGLQAIGLDDRSIEIIRKLTSDEAADVRDWATFALAESDYRDDSTTNALLDRTDDPDTDTRAEAIFGLARRGDERARSLIDREVASGTAGELILRASSLLESPNPPAPSNQD